MNINEQDLKKILDEICFFDQLEFSGIPDIDLYMDQVTTFIDDKFSRLKRNEEDTTITKTMINNYTKAGILMPPKKKKYSRQHMVLIILTYYLKQILSINDIQELFAPIVEDINKPENSKLDLKDIYDNFLAIEKKETEDFKLAFEKSLDCQNNDENKDDTSKLIIIVIKLILKASIEKRMAEKIIDGFFKDKS